MDNNAETRREFYVAMGSLAVASGSDQVLKTFVGSCVGLCLYDRASKCGGLAHVMLPHSNGKQPTSDNDAKYADHAVRLMIRMIVERNGHPDRLIARIAGGAQMFSAEGNQDESLFNIGLRNIDALKSLLKDLRIPVVSQDTGSNFGRWLLFDLSSGQVNIIKRLKDGIAA